MKKQKPRHRRLDLINSLPRGYQKTIARTCNCSHTHVSAVLNGLRSQTSNLGINIIRLGERKVDDELARNARRYARR